MDGRRRSTSAPSRRSSRSRSTAASAATSAATSSSTATATCCCRRATTRTRSSPTATRRSTSARAATRRSTRSARRPTPTTCAARSCASRSAPPAATRPARATSSSDSDPLTRPEIYLMGLRNPFRIEFNQRDRRALHRRLLAGRATRRTRCAGPAGQGKWTVGHGAGQLRLAVLRDRRAAVRRLRLRHGRVGRGVRLRRARSTSRRTTPGATQLPPVTQPDVWYSYGAVRRVPGARRPAASARWPARRTSSTPRLAKGKNLDRLAGVLRQRPALLRVDARLHQGVLHRGRRRDADRGRRRARSTSTTRSTSSSGRTGRCTCSTTATASSARTCRAPSWSRDRLPRRRRATARRA